MAVGQTTPGRTFLSPTIEVVGLGPGGPGLLTQETAQRLSDARLLFLRTRHHPSATGFDHARSFDSCYERETTFEAVYRSIVDELVAAARGSGHVVYAVPGSPSVAERSVELLREHEAVRRGEVTLVVHPALSFLDLAMERLGVDPIGRAVRVVDGGSFAIDAAGSHGPLIVAQCWDRSVLSTVKLAPEVEPQEPVTVLFHLGLSDERVWQVAWQDLDRSVEPDHLTSLWIPRLDAPVAGELVRLEELVRALRDRCPWDRRQTHGSLRRHLLEECYEVLEVLDEIAAAETGAPATSAPAPAMAALEEELGDLLFQVYFHARLASEVGAFSLADVARGVHDKLVDRHPHVFGDEQAATAEEVADNWEVRKLVEKQRTSVTDGIPAALPALALAAKLQRKATAVGMVFPSLAEEAERVCRFVELAVTGTDGGASPRSVGDPATGVDRGAGRVEIRVGQALFALVAVARELGVDPEAALRARLSAFRSEVEAIG